MDTDQNWNLLAKYFAGEASAREKELVEEWRNISDQNQKVFELFQSVWADDTALESAESTSTDIDVEQAWKQTREKIELPEVSARKTSETKAFRTRYGRKKKAFQPGTFSKYAAAAVFLLAAVVSGILLFPSQQESYTEGLTYNTGAGEILDIRLNDGSEVSLAPRSTLKVLSDFGVNARKIEIVGEAYFSVESNHENPFWVYTKNSITKVMGTRFNVKTLAGESSLEVFVTEGSVAVAKGTQGHNAEDIVLQKGDLLQTDEQQSSYEVLSNVESPAYLKWRRGLINFEDLPLSRISERLERWHTVDFALQTEELAEKRLTAEFSTEQSLKEILDAISLALNIKYNWDSGTVIFYE